MVLGWLCELIYERIFGCLSLSCDAYSLNSHMQARPFVPSCPLRDHLRLCMYSWMPGCALSLEASASVRKAIPSLTIRCRTAERTHFYSPERCLRFANRHVRSDS